LKPALDEMKDMTRKLRQKSDLRVKIAGLQNRLPVAEKALANIERLQAESRSKAVSEALAVTSDDLRQQQALIATELQAARLQLEELVAQDFSFNEASRSYLKSFFNSTPLHEPRAQAMMRRPSPTTYPKAKTREPEMTRQRIVLKTLTALIRCGPRTGGCRRDLRRRHRAFAKQNLARAQ
jgi:hypothetical protein